MATESPAILYEHADGRRAVVSANRLATFAIDNPDWHRAGPVEIVLVDETAPAWRPIETAPQPAVQQGDDLQTFAIVDSNYAAGMLLGWNLCTAGMDAEFSRIREDRMRAAVQASRAAHPAAPVAQGDAEDAARYRFLAGHCRSTSEHWGGRWSIIVDGPAPKSHDSEDDFDEAVDAARKRGGKP